MTNIDPTCDEIVEAVAGEMGEWRAEFQAVDDGKWYQLTEWKTGEPDVSPWNVTPTRIVHRPANNKEEA